MSRDSTRPRAHVLLLASAAGLTTGGIAHAGTLHVTVDDGGTAVVVLDGSVLGPAPVEVPGIEGEHELAFRSTTFGADVFTQRVLVPTEGGIVVAVNLAARRASVSGALEDAGGASPPRPDGGVADPVATPADPRPVVPAATSGDLYIASSPADAAIWIDGADTGSRTPTLLRGLATGRHAVVVRTECARADAEVDVRQARIARLDDVALVAGNGAVDVASDPPGATVFVDGEDVGPTPLALDVGCGEHTLEVRAPGFLSAATTLRTPAFERVAWTPTLEVERFGTLVVGVEPLDAVVSVDGFVLEPGPANIEEIAVGEHALVVSASGHRDWTQAVLVAESQVTRLDVVLEGGPSSVGDGKGSRTALNVLVTAVGVGMGAVGTVGYAGARSAYQDFLTVPGDAEAGRIFEDQVRPRQTLAYVGWGVGGAALAGATALWITTPATAQTAGVRVGGRW